MTKKNIILAIVLLVLVGLVYLYQKPYQEWKQSKGKPVNFLSKVDVDQLSKIIVTRSGKTTTLERSGDKWRIGGTKDFFVEQASASYLDEKLKLTVKSDLEIASQNKDTQTSFETDEAGGTNLKLYKNDTEVANFYVGKMGSDYNSTYISPFNSNMTYLVEGNLNNAVNKDDWYDKTVVSGDKEKINKIRFQYPNRQFTMEKKGDNWEGTAPNKFTVKKEKADEILDLFASLMADSIPDQKFEGTGLDKNLIIVQATGEGVDETIMVGNANKSGLYYAKNGTSDNIYLITKEQKEILDKEIKELE